MTIVRKREEKAQNSGQRREKKSPLKDKKEEAQKPAKKFEGGKRQEGREEVQATKPETRRFKDRKQGDNYQEAVRKPTVQESDVKAPRVPAERSAPKKFAPPLAERKPAYEHAYQEKPYYQNAAYATGPRRDFQREQ